MPQTAKKSQQETESLNIPQPPTAEPPSDSSESGRPLRAILKNLKPTSPQAATSSSLHELADLAISDVEAAMQTLMQLNAAESYVRSLVATIRTVTDLVHLMASPSYNISELFERTTEAHAAISKLQNLGLTTRARTAMYGILVNGTSLLPVAVATRSEAQAQAQLYGPQAEVISIEIAPTELSYKPEPEPSTPESDNG